MDATLEFLRGPVFRLSFALMVLGLLRVVFLSVAGTVEALHRAGNRTLPWADLLKKTIEWLIPVNRLLRTRPIYSVLSVLFHIGLILVPLFYSAHVLLFRESVGFAWPAWLGQNTAHVLTLLTITTGLLLFLGRAGDRASRSLSRGSDYLWPLLLVVPFITGFLCANATLSARAYQWSMLIHLLSGNLILVLIPFSKIAHCVLIPFSQVVSGAGWKFPKGAGDRVAATLGKKEVPV